MFGLNAFGYRVVVDNLEVTGAIRQIGDPNGFPTALTFAKDERQNGGSPHYVALYRPTEAGEYEVNVTVKGTNPSGFSFDRVLTERFAVRVPGIRFTGTCASRLVDSDGDGKINHVLLKPGIDVTKAGVYEITLFLKGETRHWTGASASMELTEGRHEVEFLITAQCLRGGLPADGSYPIAGLIHQKGEPSDPPTEVLLNGKVTIHFDQLDFDEEKPGRP